MNLPDPKLEAAAHLGKAVDGLERELTCGLEAYWQIAHTLLDHSGVRLKAPSPGDLKLENHFFSALFLFTYFKAGIAGERRIFYAAVNQCLRGMVTGCDNILDNEYKKTLDTDLPETAVRFRSVLDIMVSDRILCGLLLDSARKDLFGIEKVNSALKASLDALIRSGAQEASEERGIRQSLPPDQVLADVHHYKTGILFQAPWALPELLETGLSPVTADLKKGLYEIGIGCQILDDMVDLAMDLTMGRYNYLAALIEFNDERSEADLLAEILGSRDPDDPDLALRFPVAGREAGLKALGLLQQGAGRLFSDVAPAVSDSVVLFLCNRIGAARFLSSLDLTI